MRRIVASLIVACLLPDLAAAGQLVAGTPEDKLYRQIAAEKTPDTRLQMIMDFERQFPGSKVMTDIYLVAIGVYRERNDRAKIIEYGEKSLKLDEENVTVLLVLSRNYALEGKNLDRAVQLGQRALDLIAKMKTQPAPPELTESQWKAYLASTDGAARNIFEYAKALNAGR